MSAVCLAAAIPGTAVLADGQKVVTLGADLSEDQKEAILRYFGVYGQNIETLTITNQNERDHLGSYVPLEQIGTHTYSCALVNPTASGGIQVKTANLTWVTSNMIATTLSTSGVVNCEVLAAAPFEVSGTGALTGILMAYESASGASLDDTKKDLATQELITTTNVADNIGQQEATTIVNESKIQVIQGNVINQEEIQTIIDEVAEEQNITLTDEDRQLIEDLLEQIAQQDYDYNEMKDTLERVEANMEELSQQVQQGDTSIDDVQNIDISEADPDVPDDSDNTVTPDIAADATVINEISIDGTEMPETETPETLAADSILLNTDDSALGEAVVIDATNQSALAEETQPDTSVETEALQTETISVVTSDSYTGQEDISTDGPAVSDDNIFGEDITPSEGQTEVSAADEIPAADVVPAAEEIFTEAPAAGEESPADIPSETEEQTSSLDGAATLDSMEHISLSDMCFAPITSDVNGFALQPAGANELTISFPRTDLTSGSGTLTVFNAADSATYDTIAMNDQSKVSIEPLSDTELADLGWSSGGKAVITLNQPLAQNSSYFIILSEDALMSQDGAAHSEATQDNLSWMIQTAANGLTITKSGASLQAGTTVNGHIIVDAGNVPYAAISGVDTSVMSFSQYEFSESADFTLSLYQAGTFTFQVTWYDGEGNVVNTFDYTVSVN